MFDTKTTELQVLRMFCGPNEEKERLGEYANPVETTQSLTHNTVD